MQATHLFHKTLINIFFVSQKRGAWNGRVKKTNIKKQIIKK